MHPMRLRSAHFSAAAAISVFSVFGVARADCPDKPVQCEYGAIGSQGTCWNSQKLACEPCAGIRCPSYPKSYRDVAKVATEETCQEAQRREDGCSNPMNDPTSVAYRGLFKAACDQHDFCYSSTGNRKESCDGMFRENMTSICNGYFQGVLNSTPLLSCLSGATAWYGVVALHATAMEAYVNGQAWAKTNCCQPASFQIKKSGPIAARAQFALYSKANRRLVRQQGDGRLYPSDPVADLAKVPSCWPEAFTFTPIKDGMVMLERQSQYLGIDDRGVARLNATPTFFQLIDLGNDEFALYSQAVHRFVRMTDRATVVDAGPAGPPNLPPNAQWERFQLVPRP